MRTLKIVQKVKAIPVKRVTPIFIKHIVSNKFPPHTFSLSLKMTKSVNAIIIERFKSFIYINCLYEILIGLPSNLIRFSALSVGTLINNRLIARLAAT